jgi:hypothetical protein
MQQTLLEMNQILINRYLRLQRLRTFAIQDKNICKKIQADGLIQRVTQELNLTTFNKFQIYEQA